jgi:hypothetical protein
MSTTGSRRAAQKVRTVALAVFVVVVALGCGSDVGGQRVTHPTPLATEPLTLSEATPKATTKPPATSKPRATTKPTTSFYKPSGWDGHSDVDCSDFDTRAHAQSFFRGTGGSLSNDPYHLDADHDGLACELIP